MKRIIVISLMALLAWTALSVPTYVPPQILTNTEEYWMTLNPVLGDGELCYSSDVKSLRIGDGASLWSELTPLGEPLLTSVVGVPKSVLTMYNPSLTYTSRSFLFDADNTNYIDMTDSSLYRITSNSMTISLFLKVTSVSGNQVLLCRGSFGGDVGYYIQLNNGFIEIMHGNDMWTKAEAKNFVGRWVHLVLMKEGGGIWRIYKNTVEVTYDVQESDDPVTCDNVLYVGCYDSISSYIDGSISDLKIWDRMLSQAEIDDVYYGVESVGVSDLVGWWRLNETSGDTVNDSSMSNVDGLLGGSYDDVPSPASPYTKAVLTGIFYKYVECLGGRVMDPVSPFYGFEIPDYGLDNDIIWAWKVFP